MSMRELDRLKVVETVVRGELKPWRAAEKLQLSTRQIERLANRYRQDGPVSAWYPASAAALLATGR
ncbi:helix-turn-helix domain-containing protein [Cupriavidus sp. 2KB_3]|uniref:helix-turn-helix domain-containing protein n=1 Tax=Cupriavidus sp. 2KB_3 TaxID=3232980 RepID=UPI003F931488